MIVQALVLGGVSLYYIFLRDCACDRESMAPAGTGGPAPFSARKYGAAKPRRQGNLNCRVYWSKPTALSSEGCIGFSFFVAIGCLATAAAWLGC